jgi:hypothetical protein
MKHKRGLSPAANYFFLAVFFAGAFLTAFLAAFFTAMVLPPGTSSLERVLLASPTLLTVADQPMPQDFVVIIAACQQKSSSSLLREIHFGEPNTAEPGRTTLLVA